MRLELILFRLMLVVVVATTVGFGSVWAYQTKQASDWGKVLQEIRDSRAISFGKLLVCTNTEVKTSECDRYKSWEAEFDNANQSAADAFMKAKKYGLLAIAVPLAVALLFYSLRWAVTGRLRPFRPG